MFSAEESKMVREAIATGETVEQACMVHGVDADEIVEQLNSVMGE